MLEETHLPHPPPHPKSGYDAEEEPNEQSSPGAPTWLSVVWILVAVGVLLAIVVLHLTGIIGPGAH
jgi:hypothetical protein